MQEGELWSLSTKSLSQSIKYMILHLATALLGGINHSTKGQCQAHDGHLISPPFLPLCSHFLVWERGSPLEHPTTPRLTQCGAFGNWPSRPFEENRGGVWGRGWNSAQSSSGIARNPDGRISNMLRAHGSVTSLPSKPSVLNLKFLKHKGLLLAFHPQIWEGVVITGLIALGVFWVPDTSQYTLQLFSMTMHLLASKNEHHGAHVVRAGAGDQRKETECEGQMAVYCNRAQQWQLSDQGRSTPFQDAHKDVIHVCLGGAGREYHCSPSHRNKKFLRALSQTKLLTLMSQSFITAPLGPF